jgi:ribosomal protein S18 acetylase RimI-like enzyme
MEMTRYSSEDETALFDMLRGEGADWECYYGEAFIGRYREALVNSITYVAYEGAVLCGYARCRDDDGFGVYVYDLLVKKEYRGREIGRTLMERVCADFPESTVYVMSDVDDYYRKLGYRREGSIFEVRGQQP